MQVLCRCQRQVVRGNFRLTKSGVFADRSFVVLWKNGTCEALNGELPCNLAPFPTMPHSLQRWFDIRDGTRRKIVRDNEQWREILRPERAFSWAKGCHYNWGPVELARNDGNRWHFLIRPGDQHLPHLITFRDRSSYSFSRSAPRSELL